MIAVRRPVLLILASTYPRWPGDPEPGFVHELARRLTNRFRVIALSPHAPGAQPHEMMDGVEVVRYRYAPEQWQTLVSDGGIVANLKRSRWKHLLVPGFVLMQAWAAWRLIRRQGVDVIHAHWLIPQGLIAALLQLLPGCKIPFVVTTHGGDLYALKGRALDGLKALVARRAAAVTVVSTAMRQRFRALNVDDGKCFVLPMGVDLSGRFKPDPFVSRSDREVLFVGRLVEKKGLRHLLDAMPAVLQKVPDAFLTIAGFGPEEVALQQQVHSLGLQAHVRFLGAVPQADLPALYRRAALFVAPFVEAGSGDQEGLGLVLVEAAGCHCPILAGCVPAVRDVLGEGFEDRLLDPRAVTTMAERIATMLCEKKHADAGARNLREALIENFDWTRVGDRYAALLMRVQPPSNKP